MADFEYDVFISYAHLDNQPLVEGEEGWISELHRVLERRLAMLLGESPRIWRDKELRGNDYFDDVIAKGFHRAALFLSVVTPRYVKSDYCRLEFEEFCRRAQEEGSLAVGDRARVMKVLKTPIELGEMPPPMPDLLGYEFFRFDPESGKLREFRLGSQDYREPFLARLDDLAQEIAEALHMLRDDHLAATADGKVVYLAATSHDLKEVSEMVRRELQARGHRVIPNRNLPYEAEALRDMVRGELARADLSVHLVGCRYSFVPEGDERSVVEIQNDLAAARCADTALERVIWLPPDLEPDDHYQSAVVERLRTDPEAQRGAELLETTVEELKALVLERLQESAAEEAPGVSDDGPPWVYLLYTDEDEAAVAPLEDLLWERGLEVRTPLFEGDESELREEHEENLQLCDGFLIYYGEGNERWLRKMMADLKKARGLGRRKPIRAKAVYVAPPETPRKTRYRSHEADVIQAANGAAAAHDGVDAAPLEPFLHAVAGGDAA